MASAEELRTDLATWERIRADVDMSFHTHWIAVQEVRRIEAELAALEREQTTEETTQ